MSYSKAAWIEKVGGPEQIATIPSCWIDVEKETVRWPVKVNPIRAMKEMRLPQESWKTFKLTKVKLQDSKTFYFILYTQCL